MWAADPKQVIVPLYLSARLVFKVILGPSARLLGVKVHIDVRGAWWAGWIGSDDIMEFTFSTDVAR